MNGELFETQEVRKDFMKRDKFSQNLPITFQPTINYVREFHKTYEQPIASFPRIPEFKERQLRILLILEELEELTIASACESATVIQGFYQLRRAIENVPPNQGETANLVYVADAIGDLDYVVAGTNLVWGIPAELVVQEIHRSNMSKLGEDGKPMKNEYGKVLKGPGYFEPNLKPILGII